jgi:CBS domain-containing protein
MTTEVISVRPSTSLTEAVELLIEHGITGLPVVDDEGNIAGVLSEKDLMRAFYEDAKDVGSLMTRAPETIAVDAEVVDVFDSLMTHNFRRLLVEENGKLVGLVSRADLMPVVLEALLESKRRR